MLVVRGHRGVVVASDASDGTFAEAIDHAVGIARVPNEITQMIDRVRITTAIDVGQHRIERLEVRVDIGNQRVAHGVVTST